MNTFVHCRACGQPLHAQAAACPYCGAPQQQPISAAVSPPSSPALAIVSCVIGVLMVLGTLADGFPTDRDEPAGGVLLALIAVVCGALSIYHQKPGRVVAVVGLVTASIGLLVCFTHL